MLNNGKNVFSDLLKVCVLQTEVYAVGHLLVTFFTSFAISL